MADLQTKAAISAPAAALFFLLNTPLAYRLTNALPFSTWDEASGCATAQGLLLHSLIFFAVTYLTMGDRVPARVKADRSLTATLLFYVLSSPSMYELTGSPDGCPTLAANALHALAYFAALIGVMYL